MEIKGEGSGPIFSIDAYNLCFYFFALIFFIDCTLRTYFVFWGFLFFMNSTYVNGRLEEGSLFLNRSDLMVETNLSENRGLDVFRISRNFFNLLE